ncbi:hypothetical protein V6N13_037375 [Hibiscus sabdariffa]
MSILKKSRRLKQSDYQLLAFMLLMLSSQHLLPGYGYIYLMRHKFEALERFKEFKNEVQNQHGKSIKALRSNRGGEYLSQGVFLKREFLSKKGDHRNIELEEVQQQQVDEPEIEQVSQVVEENSTDLETQPLRRSTREHHVPERCGFLVTTHGDIILMDQDEPKTYQEAVSSPDSEIWLEAMRSEMDSMSEKPNYDETFSPVAMFKSNGILLAIVVFHAYEIWKMDIKTAFLNGKLEEDVYMTQPKGFVTPGNVGKVCKLQRSIYGLKQASRSWNLRFNDAIKEFGFIRNKDEPSVYKKISGSIVSFLILYVDDILIIGNDIPTLQSIKTWLSSCFSMKDLGEAAYILGVKIYRDRSRRLLGLSQSTYIGKVLKRFSMKESKKRFLPMRHDLSYALSMTSRYQANPGEGHWIAVKNILKYLRRTKDAFFVYGGEEELSIKGYTDASFQTDKNDSQSQLGFVFCLSKGFVELEGFKPRHSSSFDNRG